MCSTPGAGAAVIGAVVAVLLVMRARRKRQQAELPTPATPAAKEASGVETSLDLVSAGYLSDADLQAMYHNLAE
jgi:hypothetical protein